MNEQLIVKNFGPIKDATVDFKRVTVFIGPTGGGKSTLAKLAAVFRNKAYYDGGPRNNIHFFEDFNIKSFLTEYTNFDWRGEKGRLTYINGEWQFNLRKAVAEHAKNLISSRNKKINEVNDINQRLAEYERLIPDLEIASLKQKAELLNSELTNDDAELVEFLTNNAASSKPTYFTATRVFVPSIEYSWAGILKNDIGLPKDLLSFANEYSLSRKEVLELKIPFLNTHYIHQDGRDFIKIPEREEPLKLSEAASGIQSVTPLLVLLEHLSLRKDQAQSFIIEEPELNLFPLAQFELIKILVNKCAELNGQNDLVLTTHSPYVLTALNLMCYAFRIAQQDEAMAKKVAKLIPRNCWIDPGQFAAYYVDLPNTKKKQQVRSIINKKTGLIEENELDSASLELGNIFNKLVRLRQPTNATTRAK